MADAEHRPRNAAVAVHPKPDEVPGDELPQAVYRSVVAAFAWMMLMAWIAFGRGMEPDFALGFASLLMIVFLGILLFIQTTARHHMKVRQEPVDEFLTGDVDTATGSMPGRAAWIEIAIIPAALALAATLIGFVYMFDSWH